MQPNDSLDWISLCPADFRSELKRLIENPPSGDIPEFRDNSKDNRKIAQKWGKYAEAITARHLILKGLPLREWNWSPGKGKGEIDLITQRGNRIIFIEVKARSGTHSDPWEAIDKTKIKDLCHGADIYLKMQPDHYDYQFDIALFTGSHDNYQFEYIEDAFMCPLTVKR